jgi:flap endonuclease-1
MIDDAKLMLQLLGIPCVQAPSEGEAQAAHMAAEGVVWASNSRDYDSILFGTPRLVRYVTISGQEFLPSKGYARPLEPELIEQSAFLKELGISRAQLVDLAILVGTDFNPGIKGIGPKTALKLIREHEKLENMPESIGAQLPDSFAEVRDIFLEPTVTNDFGLEFAKMNEDGLRRFLCDERGFSTERVGVAIDRMKIFNKRLAQKSLTASFSQQETNDP